MWKTRDDLADIEPRIAQLTAQMADMPEGVTLSDALHDVMRNVRDQAISSSEGGKRLRALLALDTFDTFDGNADVRNSMLDVACAIEVFQTAALVHDDIIDDSDLRRGKPSAHRALATAMHNTSIGNGLGLMLGDMLATASISIVANASRKLANANALVTTFLTMQREVEIGQVLDLGVETNELSNPQALAAASLDVFRWKTASYTTIAPLQLGMLAAGQNVEQAYAQALAIGKPLGLAFQLADDLLDVTGSSANTGKPIGGDIREGKRTVLLADALNTASEGERKELTDIFEAKSRTETQVKRTIELFESTGAIEQSQKRITALWKQAEQAIQALDASEECKKTLEEACARFIPENLR